MTTAGYTVGWLQEYVAGLEYAIERGAIWEYLDDVDAHYIFRADESGEFAGAVVELCVIDPFIKVDTATGIICARVRSAKHIACAWQRLTDAAREEFNAYFSDLFELAQACGDFTA